MDRKCGPDPGEQRPELTTAEGWSRPDPDVLHPAGLPLHLREQAHGHHRPGASECVSRKTLGNDDHGIHVKEERDLAGMQVKLKAGKCRAKKYAWFMNAHCI